MSKQIDIGSIVRWGVVILVAVSLVAIVAYGLSHKPPKGNFKVWNTAMIKGDPAAENHFIEYTDMVCPYCAKFARAMAQDATKLDQDYFANKKVLFELRLADIISDHNINGVRANESGYCAAKQEKFWPYYNALQNTLTTDFYDKGIANREGAPDMPKLDDDYYLKAAETTKLDQGEFKQCLADGSGLAELNQATEKARRVIQSGVPYFIFNSFNSSGFDGDANTVRMMFEAGLRE
jgi:protein-disulfide isomerase